MGYKKILMDILDVKDSNRGHIVNQPDDISVFLLLKNFDLERDTMREEDFVSYERLLGLYLIQVYPEIVPQIHPGYRGPVIKTTDFRPLGLRSVYDAGRRHKWDKDNLQSRWVFERAVRQAERLLPLADFFESLSKRVLSHGRLPRAERARIHRKKVIASLDLAIACLLTEIAERWRKEIFKRHFQFLRHEKRKAARLMRVLAFRKPTMPEPGDVYSYSMYKRRCEQIRLWLTLGIIYHTRVNKTYEINKFSVVRDISLQAARKGIDRFESRTAARLVNLLKGIKKKVADVEELLSEDLEPFHALLQLNFSDQSSFVCEIWLVCKWSEMGKLTFSYGLALPKASNPRAERVVSLERDGIKKALDGRFESYSVRD